MAAKSKASGSASDPRMPTVVPQDPFYKRAWLAFMAPSILACKEALTYRLLEPLQILVRLLLTVLIPAPHRHNPRKNIRERERLLSAVGSHVGRGRSEGRVFLELYQKEIRGGIACSARLGWEVGLEPALVVKLEKSR